MGVAGHVFISYVREDSRRVDRLQQALQAAGIPVWRDTADLWPGEDWRLKIRRAITDRALAFLACFSQVGLARTRTYQRQELNLAIEEMQLRSPDEPWLIPVRFDDCEIPDRDIGGGRTLTSIQQADLFDERFGPGAERLVAAILRILRILGDQPGGAAAGPAITDRWRYAPDDAHLLARIDSVEFDHPAYSRARWPTYLRIQTLVGCEQLGETPRPRELRSLFRGLLAHAPFIELLRDIYVINPGLVWQSRATGRRVHLEADLSAEDSIQHPLGTMAMLLPDWNESPDPPRASARLVLPEPDRNHAELTLHVEFQAISYLALPDWHRRFTIVLEAAGELARFLMDDLGLATSDRPAAEAGILLRTPQTILGLVDPAVLSPERVNPASIKALPSARRAREFAASAIADPAGKTAAEVAGQMVLEMSERVLNLDGPEAELSGLAGSSSNPDALGFSALGDNAPCPCGSAVTFRACHGRPL
jgi:hypothetical protein